MRTCCTVGCACRKLEEDVGLLQMRLHQRESELAQLQQQVRIAHMHCPPAQAQTGQLAVPCSGHRRSSCSHLSSGSSHRRREGGRTSARRRAALTLDVETARGQPHRVHKLAQTHINSAACMHTSTCMPHMRGLCCYTTVPAVVAAITPTGRGRAVCARGRTGAAQHAVLQVPPAG